MKKINLYHDLFEKQNISQSILSIKHTIDNEVLYQTDNTKFDIKKEILSIQNVPDYLNFEYQTNFKKKSILQNRKGYASNLDGYIDVDSYVRSCFKRRSSNIFNRLKRLEHCFNISYGHVYGDVSKAEYNKLMNALHEMLINRFNQKQDSNYRLNEWDNLHKNTFELIRDKKASLLVIYNDLKPIQITLQYHFKNILVSAVPSYDVDYQKFGLGNVAKYKQIEWCLHNDYKICDYGHGDLENKRRWSNSIYNFEHHILFSNNSFKHTYLSQLEICKVRIMEYLKSKRVDVLLRSLNPSDTKYKRTQKLTSELDCDITNVTSHEINIKEWYNLDWDNKEYAFLRKHIFNFLYVNIQHLNDVTVLKNDRETNSYVIKGGTKLQKVVFNPVKT